MNIYPAIDLKSAACVRLTQGCYDQMTVYSADPVNVAVDFARQGATALHVVDLDGARDGSMVNLEIIMDIARQSGLRVQTGGGIRTAQHIERLLDNGISRVIIGSIAVLQPLLVREWIKIFGNAHIVLALDIRMDGQGEPALAVHGWKTQSRTCLWDLLDQYQDSNLRHVLCTDIRRDGMLQGPNLNLYQTCAERYPELSFQASGGVGSLEDLLELSKLPLDGVVVGKALYEKKFSLQEALSGVQSC